MKTTWKWILGILIVLAVIVAIPLGLHFLVNRGYIAAPMMRAFHQGPTGPAFNMPYKFDGRQGPRGFEGQGGWMPRGRGFGFFGPFMIFGGLLKLAVFFGLLYGAYWLGRRNARIALDPAPPAGAVPAPKRGTRAVKKS